MFYIVTEMKGNNILSSSTSQNTSTFLTINIYRIPNPVILMSYMEMNEK